MNAIEKAMQSPAQRSIDGLQNELAKLPQIECPLRHSFVPGFYVRQIFMPAGSLVISKIHKTEHPYVITRGKVSVWIEGVGVQNLRAPFTGITKPGTRRVLYVHEDCLWTTFHATDKKVVEEIERDVIYTAAHCDQQDITNNILPISNDVLHELTEGRA